MTIEQKNILIAEFMGCKKASENEYHVRIGNVVSDYCGTKHMEFRSSWDWLTPVAIKLVSKKFNEQCMAEGFNLWIEECELLDDVLNSRWEIKKLHDAVVKVIKRYNKWKTDLDS